MSAYAAHGHFVAAAAEAFDDDGIRARAIEHNQGADSVCPFRLLVDVPHPAQVTFALFADISDEQDRRSVLDCGFAQYSRNRKHCCNAGAVVRNSRTEEFAALATHNDGSSNRED